MLGVCVCVCVCVCFFLGGGEGNMFLGGFIVMVLYGNEKPTSMVIVFF